MNVLTSSPALQVALTHAAFAGHTLWLHRDGVHSTAYAAQALVSVIDRLDEARAATIATEAFTQGQAAVVTCPKEQAEWYQDRLMSFGLTVTLRAA